MPVSWMMMVKPQRLGSIGSLLRPCTNSVPSEEMAALASGHEDVARRLRSVLVGGSGFELCR